MKKTCMEKPTIYGVAAALIFMLGGCSLLDIRGIGKKGDEDQVIFTQADKRVIFVTTQGASSNTSIGDNKNVSNNGGHRMVCAEPSPDVAKAISDALKINLSGSRGENQLSAGMERTLTESIAQLGQRLATIQLLRDELADLCRAYSNGAVTKITYTLRLSRLDKKMITLLVSEAGAGALSRGLVALTGSSEISPAKVDLQMLQRTDEKIKSTAQLLAGAVKEVEQTNNDISGITQQISDKEKNDPNGELPALKQKLADKKSELEKKQKSVTDKQQELSDQIIAKAALEATNNGGLRSLTSVSAIAGLSGNGDSKGNNSPFDLSRLQKNYMDDVDLGVLLDACFTALEDSSGATNTDNSERKQEVKGEIVKRSEDLEKIKVRKDELKKKQGDLGGHYDQFTRQYEDITEQLRKISPSADEKLQKDLGEIKDKLVSISAENRRIETEQYNLWDKEREANEKLNASKSELERLVNGDNLRPKSLLAKWCKEEGVATISGLMSRQINTNLIKRMISESPANFDQLKSLVIINACQDNIFWENIRLLKNQNNYAVPSVNENSWNFAGCVERVTAGSDSSIQPPVTLGKQKK